MQDRCFAPLDWTDPPRTRSGCFSLRGFLHNSRDGGARREKEKKKKKKKAKEKVDGPRVTVFLL